MAMTDVEASGAAATALMLENERLRAELRALLAELGACRARAIEATEAVRRRIERNLHDGTQQRLVSVAMSLGFLDAKLPAEPDAAKPIVREARETLAVTLDELRDLSRDLYPTILIERGLVVALKELCGRSGLATRLDVALDTRLPAEAEACSYFVVSEALSNVAKHAHAAEVRIAAWCTRTLLVVEVADDGIGGAAPERGSGLRGLADRVQRCGGRLIVSSRPAYGTTVRAEIPYR
jgi:signal transduction histidine kinase